jgi:hypothetical protein
MFKDTTEDRKYIEDISKSIILEVAPEEFDLFDELAEEYYQHPSPPNLSASQKADPLAFGLGGLLVPATPAVLAMVSAVLTYLATEFIDVAKKEGADVVRQKTKELFTRVFTWKENEQKTSTEKEVHASEGKPTYGEVVGETKKEAQQPLTKEQLNEIFKLAIKVAKEFGMESKEARTMAKALIGAAALSE